nr:prephenate dehydrogenase [uncultured Solibaculum sp.]
MNITIVGLGLIGGSLAKAISSRTHHTVFGIDRDPKVLDQALADGAIHHDIGLHALEQSDLIFVALYPSQCIEFVRQNASLIQKGTVVTDVCGVKKSICDPLIPVAKEAGFYFVGGHPMAGREQYGFEAAKGDLFDGASYVLTPSDGCGNAVEVIQELVLSIGCGRVVLTTPEDHDRRIAYTSQLPHVLAAAYVNSPTCPMHVGYSAGSYLDVSRVARINENLWPELFIQNSEALTTEIDFLIENLTRMRQAVASRDQESLTAALRNSRKRKETYG